MSGREGQGLTQVNSVVEARRNTFKKPKADPVRLLVFDILTEVNRRDGYSNLLLPRAMGFGIFYNRHYFDLMVSKITVTKNAAES